jgi:hypothetical protein
MRLLHVTSSPLNSTVVFAITRLLNKEFLYYSVLECSTTTARVLFLTCEFTMFVVSVLECFSSDVSLRLLVAYILHAELK